MNGLSHHKIAQYLLDEIDNLYLKNLQRHSNGLSLFYKHGDGEVMDGMSELFKSANEEYKKTKVHFSLKYKQVVISLTFILRQ